MTDTTTEPLGCEHLDGPYRKLLDEVQHLRAIEAAAREFLRRPGGVLPYGAEQLRSALDGGER